MESLTTVIPINHCPLPCPWTPPVPSLTLSSPLLLRHLYLYVSYSKKGHHETVGALPEMECDMEKTQNKLDCIVCFNNRKDCIKACSIYSAVGSDRMHQLQNSIWCIWHLNLQSRYSANCRIGYCSMSTSFCFKVTQIYYEYYVSSIWMFWSCCE